MATKYAMVYTFSPGCHGSTSNITDPDADIAAFLLTRGPHASSAPPSPPPAPPRPRPPTLLPMRLSPAARLPP